jgi:HlyD family secretion protein
MSFSMLLGRVILPAAGLMLAAGIAWNSLRTIATQSETGSVDGSSAASQPNGRITAEGRVVAYPGAEVTVSTEVLGTIISMPAREKVLVKKGDLLVELRADDVRASLREAHHRLSEAEVAFRLEQTRARLDRIIPALTGRDRQPPDARTETLAAAQARRDADKAAVDRIDAESAKYRILAPIDGTVVARYADPGETVSAASPLVKIVDLTRLRVEAEVDEFDIAALGVGAKATLMAEGYSGRRLQGEVEEIADVVVPRQSRPEDPGRPADTRVLPVKVAFREASPLKLGQRVEIEISSPAVESALGHHPGSNLSRRQIPYVDSSQR